MPMKRSATLSSPLDGAVEFLVYLQTNGYLDNVEVPSWAVGGHTAVWDLMSTLEYLGDAEWLDDAYPNCGSAEAADRWLSVYLEGRIVPDKEDVAAHREAIERGEIVKGCELVMQD